MSLLENRVNGIIGNDNAENVRLILTDNNMPFVSGSEIIERHAFRLGRDYKIPVFLMSGMMDERKSETALRNGAYACIRKPFDFVELEQQIKQALGYESVRE